MMEDRRRVGKWLRMRSLMKTKRMLCMSNMMMSWVVNKIMNRWRMWFTRMVQRMQWYMGAW